VDRLEREQRWTMQMRAALRGDQVAYAGLLQELSGHLRTAVRGACSRAGLSADVEDIVQETLLAVHLKRHTWDSERSIGPWLTAISRYKLIDAIRRRNGNDSVQIDELADVLPAEPDDDGLAGRDARKALEALDGRQREIVQIISLEGGSVRDAAAKLQMNEGAVRVALHRALKKLAALYRSEHSSHGERAP
jgi:RNA polymerase sigma factor (sigma-70 family)